MIKGNEVKNINYINRFIVGGKDEFFKVNFVEYDYFENILCDYDDLHKWNYEFYSGLKEEFFKNIVLDEERIKYQYLECRERILNAINFIIEIMQIDENKREVKDISIEYNGKELILYMDASASIVTKLNSDESLNKFIKGVLKQYFNYEGIFWFSEELPF
jgi:hypothetical protein